MMMIKFLAIWLADRCGLFEETEAAANAYLQSKSAYEAAEEHWRSRLSEAEEGLICSAKFQIKIAELLGIHNDGLDGDIQRDRIIQTITEIANGLSVEGYHSRDFLDKLVKILIRVNTDCDTTSIDLLRSIVIDAAAKLAIEHKRQTEILKEFQRIGGEFVAISGRSA
jgi:hypothetical protein